MYVFKKRGADTWGYRLFYLWRQRSSQTLVTVHFLGPRPVDKLLYPLVPHSTRRQNNLFSFHEIEQTARVVQKGC